jgi:serine/threonine-protein kinase RsbT
MSENPADETPIQAESDIVLVRRTAREAAITTGFDATDVTRIVTACSEMARNIFKYAGEGTMCWRVISTDNRRGIELEFRDRGPGIADVDLVMQEGYSSSGGLGMGLPGTKRLMDELQIHSTVGQGTTIILKKWLRRIP